MSKLKLVAIGLVTEDKERESWSINAYPIEIIPSIDGKPGTLSEAPKVKQKDIKGSALTDLKNKEATLTAVWLQSEDSQRITPPDVVANERVYIYQYNNEPNYYWRSSVLDKKIRRTEDVIYAFGDLSKPLEEWDLDSSWFIRVNTKDKFIQVRTATSDDEKYQYEVKIDAKNNQLFLKDDNGQEALLNSEERTWLLKAEKSVTVDTPDTYITGNLWVKGKGQIKGNTDLKSKLDVAGITNVNGKLNANGGINAAGCKGCI